MLSKMVYLNHRSFLPDTDILRTHKGDFPSKCVKVCPKTQAFVDKFNGEYSASLTAAKRKNVARESGCKGPYSLRRLPQHNRHLNTPVESMHTLKNVGEHIVGLLSGKRDSMKVRQEERSRNRFRDTWTTSNSSLPEAPFCFNKDEAAVANERILCIKVPHGTDWRSQQIFSKSIHCHLKSNHWKHILASGILKFCI